VNDHEAQELRLIQDSLSKASHRLSAHSRSLNATQRVLHETSQLLEALAARIAVLL
jgi:hypothetical protein